MIDELQMDELVRDLIYSRQSVMPKRLFEPGCSKSELDIIFTAAASAPDHAMIHPWRFILCSDERRDDLAKAFMDALYERDPNPPPEKIESAKERAYRAPTLMLAVVNARGLSKEIPLSERIISAGCAIQNVLLMAHAMGYGAAPTSGNSMYMDPVRRLFNLSAEEDPLCFISIGTPDRSRPLKPRMIPSDFVSSI